MFHKTEESPVRLYREEEALEQHLIVKWQQLAIVQQLFPLQGATLVMSLHPELLSAIPESIKKSFGLKYQVCIGYRNIVSRIEEYASISRPYFHNVILLGLFSTQQYKYELSTHRTLKSLQFIAKNIITIDVNWFGLKVDSHYWSKKFGTFGPDESLRKHFSWEKLHTLYYDPTFMTKVLPHKQKISEQVEIDHVFRAEYLQELLNLYYAIAKTSGPSVAKIELAKHQIANCASAIRRAPPILVNLITTPAS